jgi:pyruvate dehydrogenase E2 component (dihydrolipoamide acetyltransferase)
MSISMEDGKLTRWLVADGAEVRAGDIVALVETDKAEVEVEATEDGVLHIVVPEGTVAAVESVIATIGERAGDAGEDEPTIAIPVAVAPAERPRAVPITAADLVAGPPPSGSFAAVGAARGTGTVGRAAPAAPAGPAPAVYAGGERSQDARLMASPAARRRARERGIDLRDVRGRGPRGRVVIADVEEHVTGAPVATATSNGGSYPTTPPAPAPAAASAGVRSAADLRPSVVNALTRGWQSIPHTNIGGELEAEALPVARAAARGTQRITYTDLLLVALARALGDVPDAYGSAAADGSVTRGGTIDINLAVATPGGVVAPLVRDLAALSVVGVARERERLVGAAREGRIESRDLAPGGCTLSNLGAYPVDFFTPVLSGPQVSLVAVGRLAEKVVARDGMIGVGHRLWANVCLDHRAADGEAGGRLLAALQRRIADLPTSL